MNRVPRLLVFPLYLIGCACVLIFSLALVLFFGVTRTDYGRDQLRMELERQITNRYAVRLHIGGIHGNLRHQILAGDIRLYSKEDSMLFRADSIIATPHWRSFFSRRISFGSLLLVNPAIRIQTDSTGSLVLPSGESDWTSGDLSDWIARRTELIVTGGSLRDQNANAIVQELNFRTVMDHRNNRYGIDIHHLAASISEHPIRINDLSGEFTVSEGTLYFGDVNLSTDVGNLDLTGSLTGFSKLESAIMDLGISWKDVSWRTLEVVLPQLGLTGLVSGSAMLAGTLENITVEDLEVKYLGSSIAGAGGLQRSQDSLFVFLQVRESRLLADDFQPVLPSYISLGRDFGALQMQGDLQLRRSIQGFRAQANLALQSNAGRATGSVSVGQPINGIRTYTAFFRCDALNLAAITNRYPYASDLNGLLSFEGSGMASANIHADFGVDLSSSSISGRTFDALQADLTLGPRTLRGTMRARSGDGSARLGGGVTWEDSGASFAINMRTDSMDLGPLVLSDSLSTSLSGDWSISGEDVDRDNQQVRFAVQLDSSAVGWGIQALALPAHTVTATLASTAENPLSLHMKGDLLDLTLESTERSLHPWVTLWGAALRSSAERWKNNVHTGQARNTVSAAPFSSGGLDGSRLEMHLVPKPLLTKAWVAPDGFDATIAISAEDDVLAFQAEMRADTAAFSHVRATDLRFAITGSASLNGPVETTLSFESEGSSSFWRSGPLRLESPRLLVTANGGRSMFHLATSDHHQNQISGAVAVTPGSYRVELDTLNIAIGSYLWRQVERSIINVFSDALQFEAFRLETDYQRDAAPQSIQIGGLVANGGDAEATVILQSIGLGQLSDYIGGRRGFGGVLSGQINWSRLRRPVFQGQVRIADLQLEDHVVGQLIAHSRYNPLNAELALEISLNAAESAQTHELAYVENNLAVSGTVKLPGPHDSGSLDLALEAPRIDAFFLQHLIEGINDVKGRFSGSGTVAGTFNDPIFAGEFDLTDGSFRIPAYDLWYAAVGEVRVVPDGVALDRVVLEDSTGGAATVNGVLGFNNYRFLSLDLMGELDQLQIMNIDTYGSDLPFFGQIWAFGDITLTGPIHDTFLSSPNLEMAAKSDLYIPIIGKEGQIDPGFIVYADSAGTVPETRRVRRNILERRGEGERNFADGLQMDLNIQAPQNSNIHLVIDPLLGDVINSVGSGRVQLQLLEGDVATFGTFNVDSGDYLFTAGELFVRRFIINEGSITWMGDPLDPLLNISADYRTRASRTGLPKEVGGELQTSLPLIVGLEVGGALSAVQIELDLSVDQRQEAISDTPLLEAYLNQSDRAAQHATSVLVTNSFLLSADATSNDGLAGSAFNSVSNLVASQLNRYISQVIPNADLTLGLQSDESAEDLDVSAAIALRMLDERLVFSGQGVYRGLRSQVEQSTQEGLEGEVQLEIHLTPRISFEMFYRREGDVLSETLMINETGAGLSYQAQFTTWRSLIQGIFKGGGAGNNER